MTTEKLIAVFVDYENLAYGVKDTEMDPFRINPVLKWLQQKGRIVYKRAYYDCLRYRKEAKKFHRKGFEVINIPNHSQGGKNSADIRMVVDAMDLCYTKPHIDIFAFISGDSDFSPLASKLKENQKQVVGCGVKKSCSDLLVNNCDEFIFYENVLTASKQPNKKPAANPGVNELLETVRSLAKEHDPLWISQVSQAMHRAYPVPPGFTELVKSALQLGLLAVEADPAKGKGSYKVRLKKTN